MRNLKHYERFADVFDYPAPDYPLRVQRLQEVVRSRYPEAVTAIDIFARMLCFRIPLPDDTLDDLQEVFTRSFDVQAITTLGVGYVMFGDDYKRGELLVNLSRELKDAGIESGVELPDHLPTVLRLVAVWRDQDLRREFVEEILHPSIEMMLREFDPDRVAFRNDLYLKHNKTLIDSPSDRRTMFREPLQALLAVLKKDFGLPERTRPERDNDFLRSIDREFEIEADETHRNPSRGAK